MAEQKAPETVEEAVANLEAAAAEVAAAEAAAPKAPEAPAASERSTEFELRADSTGRQFKVYADGNVEVLDSPSAIR